MAEVAAHLTDRVLPWLPVRQWVLSVPKRPRPYLQGDPRLASGVLGIYEFGFQWLEQYGLP